MKPKCQLTNCREHDLKKHFFKVHEIHNLEESAKGGIRGRKSGAPGGEFERRNAGRKSGAPGGGVCVTWIDGSLPKTPAEAERGREWATHTHTHTHIHTYTQCVSLMDSRRNTGGATTKQTLTVNEQTRFLEFWNGGGHTRDTNDSEDGIVKVLAN